MHAGLFFHAADGCAAGLFKSQVGQLTPKGRSAESLQQKDRKLMM